MSWVPCSNGDPRAPPFNAIGHDDERTDTTSFWYAGADSAPGEPCFVPSAPDSPEGDGWLITVVGRRSENRTDVVVLDARDLPAGPVAVIRLPLRIHEGFHGIWMAAT